MPAMAPRRSGRVAPSLALLLSASIPLAAAQNTVDDSRCNCYITNGSDVTYFVNHKFYDFRSLSQHAGIPPLIANADEATRALPTSDYFISDDFAKFWEIQNWNNSISLGTVASNASVLRVNSPNNIYIERNGIENVSPQTWLTLRTARQTQFQSTAEMVTRSDAVQFLSMRMMARTIGAPGACTAMFTYRTPPADQPGAKLQEADLEMLTKYPRDQVQCTNQPSIDDAGQLIEPSTKNVTLPGHATWDNWAIYRMDWTPRQTTWYMNGVQIANISFQTPTDPARVHLNAWSDGGNWTGAMAFRTDAHMHIQWWELLYNSTEKEKKPEGKECKAVCSIDASNTLGKAVMISNSLAPGRLLDRTDPLAAVVAWIPSVATLVMLMLSSSALWS